MDVKDVKSNKWVSHIKKYAAENGMSYREAMRNDGCKTAYKTPVPERSPSPVREPSPEPLVSTPVKKGRGKKLADPMPMPALVRYEAEQVETTPEVIPAVVKKERKRRESKFVPT
jgi:hypothetical protein